MTDQVQYTEVKPGGTHVPQNDLVVGGLDDVRAYIDTRRVWAADPITVTEAAESDGIGRAVPASEWDV